MKKAEAIEIFGGVPVLTEAMGFKSRHSVYMWDEELPKAISDRVIGAAMRAGGEIEERAMAFLSLESEQREAA